MWNRDRERERKTHEGFEWLSRRTWTRLYRPMTSLFITLEGGLKRLKFERETETGRRRHTENLKDLGGGICTLQYRPITPSSLFISLERGSKLLLWESETKTGRGRHTDYWKDLDTAMLTLIFLAACAIFIFRAPLCTSASLTSCSQFVFARRPLGPRRPLGDSKTQNYRITTDDCWLLLLWVTSYLGQCPANALWISSGRKTETDHYSVDSYVYIIS